MRKAREAVESITEQAPTGPLGIAGNGRLVGGSVFFTVSIINGVNPLENIDVGFNIESSDVKRFNEDSQLHTYVINAVSKDVAKVAAIVESRPSIVDTAVREAELTDVKLIEERRWMSDWRVQVRVDNNTP